MAETLVRHIRGISIFERRAGKGPPTVVLHGGPGAHHDYLLPAMDALARGRTLVYYDQRGGGRSPVDRSIAVGWREQVADLEALRAVWGIDRLTLLGYSWGGLLAVLYATEFPSRVSELALVAPAPAWRAAREEFEQAFAERNRDPTLEAERRALRESGLGVRDPDFYRQRLFELSVAAYFYDRNRARDLTPFRVTNRTEHEVWASLGDYDLRPRLAQLAIPALVLHGEHDAIPTAASRTLAQALDAEFHLLPNCGHAPFIEAFEQFVALLDDFLPLNNQDEASHGRAADTI
ncbi:MAG: alpha/beta fold hydrolase [Gemmatimonadales bacterium]|nr:alpha/beta fold hydrolase [Gemmatimonadales bacterium]